MRDFPQSVVWVLWLLCPLLAILSAHSAPAQPIAASSVATSGSANSRVEVTGDRIEYLQEVDTYQADGSVVILYGDQRLTADHVTIHALTGHVIATGNVHLVGPVSEVWGEQLRLDINTEGGLVANGQVHFKQTNTFATGRLLQRYSESHYRIKEGSFTNCDAKDGEVPAWRFTFQDLDLDTSDSLAMKGAWFCVLDHKLLPLPTLTYPVSYRKTGFLIPSPTFDNRFGLGMQVPFFWAINPSQDLLITPNYYSNLGYGSDFGYRYILNRQSRGQWLASVFQQEQLPKVSGVQEAGADVRRIRGLLSGNHVQQFDQDLRMIAQVFFVSDPDYLQQLSNSGVARALPSGESNLLTTQRWGTGNLYLLGQYLQPLQSGGSDTFQRLPELGYSMANTATPLTGPLQFNMDTGMTYFYRDEGFHVGRATIMPGLTTDTLNLGHVVGLTPQAKFLESYYSRGAVEDVSVQRQTFWAALEAKSRLTKRYGTGDGTSMLHTIEPQVIYEYVPASDQSQIAQIDQLDDLPKKNLVTYAVRSRLLENKRSGSAFNWLDLMIAQSYHVGAVQTRARDFTPGAPPTLGTITQPLFPATTTVDGRKFSDLWIRAMIGNNTPEFIPGLTPNTIDIWSRHYSLNQYLTVDAFVDPYKGTLSQFNTDFRVQNNNAWYIEVGQRYAREGNLVRRGDIWNPISFNEVYAPTSEIQFVTAMAAVRLSQGWTVGARGYYDLKNGRSPEYDVVGMYQNPCKCWSLGMWYLQFPDRVQYNVVLSLTGIGWTENFGTAVLKTILSPIMIGERGLPWAAVGGPYGRMQPAGQSGASAIK
ncbi:LPS-assembly protein LptD [Nitrospira tepida]|uniref:LPS-assembly protein LptD n=1 Tax=Nitrospira tepida TaxID=2973512 RepID=A0AA86MYZ6_9BACT|nr:LPS assembly protein LptD [Nitrospira tepida]CAI4031518.1 LPS-assembly protein LptD [Nitrospira tepida]